MKNNIPKEYYKSAGVYQILNTVNGKCYIGSTYGFQQRFASHLCRLISGKHNNPHLQSSINKYGKDVFTFTVLEVIESPKSELLCEREQYYIESLGTQDIKKGYNIRKVAKSNKGIQIIRGEKTSCSTITNDEAKKIKILLLKGWQPAEIIKTCSVNHRIIASIKRNESWKFIAPTSLEVEVFEEPPRPQVRRNLTKIEVKIIRLLSNKGYSRWVIAKYLPVISEPKVITNIVKGEKYKKVFLLDSEVSKIEDIIDWKLVANLKDEQYLMFSTLKADEVRAILLMLSEGLSCAQVARIFNVSAYIVSCIKLGKRHSNITGIQQKRNVSTESF